MNTEDKNNHIKAECLVIGSGIAGLRAALELSKRGREVILVTKTELHVSNTEFAQGGISAVDPKRVEDGKDSFTSHVKDTLKAGAGLCDTKIVTKFVERSYTDTIQALMDFGVEFSEVEDDKTSSGEKYKYVLHQEGGHENPRIYCVGDFTGKAIEDALCARAQEDKNITILEYHSAIDLITKNWTNKTLEGTDTCLGAYVLDQKNEIVKTIEAKVTFLATGGAGRAFLYTSNCNNVTGDGIGMAYRARATIANMEFFQFHPTVLFDPDPEQSSQRRFLLTEALRGKNVGGILTLNKDEAKDFVLEYTDEGSSGTRDIVARAIDTEIKNRGLKHVWLNVTTKVSGKSEKYLKHHFPKIFEHCLSRGINMATDPVPIIPAAHYTCGGVVVDDNGKTDIENLYAIGEVSCTGLMGANRLASNSLPEGALYGLLAVENAVTNIDKIKNDCEVPMWHYSCKHNEIDKATVNQFWDTTRTIMTTLCGINRNEQRLTTAVAILNGLITGATECYRDFYPTKDIIELRNLTQVCLLIAKAALNRKESRGGHFRADFPEKNDVEYSKNTLIKISNYESLVSVSEK